MRRNLTPEFSNRALYQNAGDAAAIQIYDGNLGGLIELFFGSGSWTPDPETLDAVSTY